MANQSSRDPERAYTEDQRKSGIRVAFRWAISIAILAVLFARIDTRQTASLFAAADLRIVALAIAVALLARLMTAYRWFLVTRHVTSKVRYWYLAQLTFIANFVGTFLPGTIGIDAVRAYGLARTTSNTSLSVSTLIVERVLGLITMMVLALVGARLAPPGLPKSLELFAGAGLTAVAVFITLACNGRLVEIARNTMRRFLPRTVYAFLSDYMNYFNAYTKARKLMLISILLAVLMQFLRIAQLYIGARALHLDLSFYYFVVFAPLVTLIIQVPISIGGIGVREGAYIFLFGLVAVSSESAFAISMMYFFVGFAAVLPGALFYAKNGLVQPS